MLLEFSAPEPILYGYIAISGILFVYLLSLVIKRLRALHHTLSIILTNVDSSRNLNKCTVILDNLVLGLVFFFVATLSPFIIFAFKLSLWTNVISFVMLIISAHFLNNLVSLVDGNSKFSYLKNSSASDAGIF